VILVAAHPVQLHVGRVGAMVRSGTARRNDAVQHALLIHLSREEDVRASHPARTGMCK